MIITYENQEKHVPFREISVGDLFIYNGRLALRTGNLDTDGHYNTCIVQGGNLRIKSDMYVVPVKEIKVFT